MTHLPDPPIHVLPDSHPCLGCLSGDDAGKRACARRRLLDAGHAPETIDALDPTLN